MTDRILLLLVLLAISTVAPAQELEALFTDVDTIYMPNASPGNLLAVDEEVVPLISSSECNLFSLFYAVARPFQAGRVIAIGHEALLTDGSIPYNDNLLFVRNAIGWLASSGKRVSLQEGWVHNGNTSILRDSLTAKGYTFGILSGALSAAQLENTDILILGNDWNGLQPYQAAELAAIENFVATGGALLIAGLGWSWPDELANYPMEQAARLFGFRFGTQVISEMSFNVNGSPKLFNFYPHIQNGEPRFYCPSPFIGTNLPRGNSLKVLRLAVSTNGEFTQQNGGVDATRSLIDQWLEAINHLYGREYCVRFELIPNNDQLIYPDPASDPWGTLPPGSGGCTNADIIFDDQFNVFNSVIGAENYDLSHVILGAPFGGGCAGGRQTAVSGGLDIPVTRHELGHQLGQSHTINHGFVYNFEPENGGWTIQGGNAHGYAHAVSYHQLARYLRNLPASVGFEVPTENTIPTVDAGPDVHIPIGTPFVLSGTAYDPDPADILTYVWDNMDGGLPRSLPTTDDSHGAIFMRLLPDTSASRTFPRMSDVIANNAFNEQEQLPTQPRIMDIRLTVNDNHRILYEGAFVNASGTNSDDLRLTVADAGPFVVTSQNSPGLVYPGASEQLVTWDVNGTDSPPIDTRKVRISLSTDGGWTYPITLADSTDNDGSALVTLPNLSSATARIQVAAVDNIYFDINTRNFEIQEVVSGTANPAGATPVVIYPNPARAYFDIETTLPAAYRVQLFDTQGRLRVEQRNKKRVETAGLSGGMYVLVLTDLATRERAVAKVAVVRY